jgi:NAD(P)-dependent dehydrogenase (short-subunit alcohol dehydrogenase family)
VIDLSGRVVIVTGGNSGIGLGIARGVARAGASVAIWSRREERNAEAVAELEGLGATALGVQCDVGDEDTVAGAMRATFYRLGRLDCLVANAGTIGRQLFTDMSLAVRRLRPRGRPDDGTCHQRRHGRRHRPEAVAGVVAVLAERRRQRPVRPVH